MHVYFRMKRTLNASYSIVIVQSKDGDHTYSELHAGTFFGEVGYLFNIPRTASIVAKTSTHCAVLHAKDLEYIRPTLPDLFARLRQEGQTRYDFIQQEWSKQGRIHTSGTFGVREEWLQNVDSTEFGANLTTNADLVLQVMRC